MYSVNLGAESKAWDKDLAAGGLGDDSWKERVVGVGGGREAENRKQERKISIECVITAVDS